MADNTANVNSWAGGAVAYIDLDEFDPDDADLDVLDEIPAGWSHVGIHDEDAGVSSTTSQTVTEYYGRSSAGSVLVMTTVSKQSETITFSAVEENPAVKELTNPGFDAETDGGITTITQGPLRQVARAFLFDSYNPATGERLREIYPNATVTEVGQVDRKAATPTMFPITVKPALFDDEGNTKIEKRDGAAFAVGS